MLEAANESSKLEGSILSGDRPLINPKPLHAESWLIAADRHFSKITVLSPYRDPRSPNRNFSKPSMICGLADLVGVHKSHRTVSTARILRIGEIDHQVFRPLLAAKSFIPDFYHWHLALVRRSRR